MANIDKALSIAVQAHSGQRDRYGRHYILHPLRVMHKVTTDREKIVAILHDIIEDTDWTTGQLGAEGFSPEIIQAVDALSKRENESYVDYIERLMDNPLAVIVKLADLEDNMDIHRIEAFTEEDGKRLARYHRTWEKLIKTTEDTAGR